MAIKCTVTYTYNCSANANISIDGSRSDGLGLSDPYPLGLTTITWTSTDEAGNQTSCEQQINVVSSCSPGGVSNGLELWLRSNSGVYHNTSIANNGDGVSLWDDQIYNNDAVSSTVNNAPVFSVATSKLINYNPVLVFDGIDNYLTSPLNTSEMVSTMSIFIVAKPVNEGAILGIGGDAAIWFLDDGAVKASFNNGSALTTTATNAFSNSKVNILSIVKSGNVNGDVTISKNGIDLSCSPTACSSIPSAADIRIGVDLASTIENVFKGDVAEIIIYNRNLSAIEKQRIESYLAIKYGITMGD